MKNKDMRFYEKKCISSGKNIIAGLDEVGRGCWAGPLVVACVILPNDYKNDEIDDSKKLSEKTRENLSKIIKTNALAYEIVFISPNEVDRLNPKKASIVAMEKALQQISLKPDIALIDAEKINTNISTISIIKGDQKSISIAAASILAKVARDNYMKNEIAKLYPIYEFEKHKGYGTKLHASILESNGPIKNIHRFSYKPIKKLVES